MKAIKMTNQEAALLTSTLERLAADDEKKYHLANGKNPAYQRSVYLSDVNCRTLVRIVAKFEEN